MANDIGKWNNGAGTSNNVFPGGYANIGAGLHLAGAGETINHVRMYRLPGGATNQQVRIGLFVTTAGIVADGATPVQSVAFATTPGGEFGADVTWALTPGLVYALAMGTDEVTVFAGSRDASVGGSQTSETTPITGSWLQDGTSDFLYDLAGDITFSAPAADSSGLIARITRRIAG